MNKKKEVWRLGCEDSSVVLCRHDRGGGRRAVMNVHDVICWHVICAPSVFGWDGGGEDVVEWACFIVCLFFGLIFGAVGEGKDVVVSCLPYVPWVFHLTTSWLFEFWKILFAPFASVVFAWYLVFYIEILMLFLRGSVTCFSICCIFFCFMERLCDWRIILIPWMLWFIEIDGFD